MIRSLSSIGSVELKGAKRQRTTSSQLATRLKPEIQFRMLSIDKADWSTNAQSEKLSAHADSSYNLYVSDTTRVVCFNKEGVFREVVRDIEHHHIVPNCTADHVYVLRKSDKQKLLKVMPDGQVSTLFEVTTPLYGPDICLDGDIVHHPSTNRLEKRRALNGELTASIEGGRGKVISFEANSYLASAQDGHVYFSSKTCVYRWNLGERTVECIAGHPKAAGRRDGFGTDARFQHLKRPVLTRNFAYVRESDNRFCRIDLDTFEVSTLQMRGVDSHDIETYGVTPDGRMMFLILTGPFRIYTADTTDTLESTFCADLRRVDWTGATGARVSVEFIAGKDKRVYCTDGRILEARSAYFRSMLSGGMREASENPIDLGEDVSGEALHVLLHFLHTDQFELVTPPTKMQDMRDEEVLKHAKFALEVHTLADKFLLPRLARLCEVFLADFALRASIVLPLLARITASPPRASLSNLEAACWEYLEENWKLIVQHHSSSFQELVDNQHPLAVELLRSSTCVRRPRGRRQDDPPAES